MFHSRKTKSHKWVNDDFWVKYPLIQVTGSRSGNTSVLKKLRRDGSVCVCVCVCANALRPVALLCMTSALLTTCGRVCLCVNVLRPVTLICMHDFSTTDNVCMCVCVRRWSHTAGEEELVLNTHTHTQTHSRHIPLFPGLFWETLHTPSRTARS